MRPSWFLVVSKGVNVSAPYVLLAWAWVRWICDPHRASLPRWRDFIVLLSLLLVTGGAVLYALYATGHMHPRPVPGSFSRWPLTYANGMLYALLGGLVLSVACRGFLRFLVGVACLWLTMLCLLAWRVPQDFFDRFIDALDRTVRG